MIISSRIFLAILGTMLLAGCHASPALPTTLTPTMLPTSTPTETLSGSLVWQVLAPGITQTEIPVSVPEADYTATVRVFRLNPAAVQFRVFHDADEPLLIGDWLARLNAAMVFNGGFFTPEYQPAGWLVADGHLSGTSLSSPDWPGRTGIFGIMDNHPVLFADGQSAYSPIENRYYQAVETYPVLMLNGKPVYAILSGSRARRTVIGLDQDEQVMVIIVDSPVFTLAELAQWLVHSHLGLRAALNLDGGGSTGLAVHTGETQVIIDSYSVLPVVFGVFPAE